MTSLLYTIYDHVAKEAGPIFTAANNGVAIRNFRTTLQQIDSDYQADYTLHCVGSYDSTNMEIDTGLGVVQVQLSDKVEVENG